LVGSRTINPVHLSGIVQIQVGSTITIPIFKEAVMSITNQLHDPACFQAYHLADRAISTSPWQLLILPSVVVVRPFSVSSWITLPGTAVLDLRTRSSLTVTDGFGHWAAQCICLGHAIGILKLKPAGQNWHRG